MDISEFVKQVKPRAKRSQLDPFKAQIFELRKLGYANWQIRDWLATVGIEVTQESVRKFVVTREGSVATPSRQEGLEAMKRGGEVADTSLSVAPGPEVSNSTTAEPATGAVGLSPKQRREKRADEFIKSENPVLNKLVKKKDP